MPLISAGITDIGQKRKTNQDSIYLNPEKNLFIVADGMGGHNGGDIASALAVKHIPDFFSQHALEDPQKLLVGGIRHAGIQIRKRGEADPKLEGMGTTAVAFYFRGNTLYVGNVGDSRAYLVSKKCLYQLSRDHSMIQEKINIGLYTREQAAADPHKNVLVRTVGLEDDVEVDVFTYKVCKNDLFLLCSDGLHGKVSERDLVQIVDTYLPDPAHASRTQMDNLARALVAQANHNGGQDNISVILVLAQGA